MRKAVKRHTPQSGGSFVSLHTPNYCLHFLTETWLFQTSCIPALRRRGFTLVSGKNPKGQFTARLDLNDDIYTLTFKDDGAGADLERIKAKATKMELFIPANEDEVIDLLFCHEMSTKLQVTENSGRGVGLDAVRFEARKLSGDAKARNHPDGGLEIKIWFKKQDLVEILTNVKLKQVSLPLAELKKVS